MKTMSVPAQRQVISYSPPHGQERLFSAVALGDESAFTEMVHNFFSKLLPIAFRIVKNQETAEDIVQDAFVALWQKRREITPDNLGGWLHKVVIHSAYKHVKKESRKIRLHRFLQSDGRDFHTHVEECLTGKESAAIISGILSRLPEKQYAVYSLSREKGLGRNDIASRLNMSPNTVKVHLFRALRFIKENIAGTCFLISLFVFNNLIFRGSNTFTDFRDLNKVNHIIDKNPPRKIAEHFAVGRSVSLVSIHR